MNNPIIFGLAFGLTLTMVVIGLALMRHAKREEKLRDRLRMANGTYVAKAGQASAGPQAGAALARVVASIGGRIASRSQIPPGWGQNNGLHLRTPPCIH